MADAINLHIDDVEFQEALRRLAMVSPKTCCELVNQKAYRITQKAVWYSPQVSEAKIAADLGAVRVQGNVLIGKRGRGKGLRVSMAASNITNVFTQIEGQRTQGENTGVPVLALIIQARAGFDKGGKLKFSPWYGKSRAAGAAAMAAAMLRVYGARQKSRAYFKACFATARDIFKLACRKPTSPDINGTIIKSQARDRGRLADGKPALDKPIATFWITSPRHDLKEAIYKYAQPALQRAFDEEAGDTWRHAIELEYKEECAILGIKTS